MTRPPMGRYEQSDVRSGTGVLGKRGMATSLPYPPDTVLLALPDQVEQKSGSSDEEYGADPERRYG